VVWKVKVGDQIKAGDSIAEIETDKVSEPVDSVSLLDVLFLFLFAHDSVYALVRHHRRRLHR
jgi:hypothetical protein